MKGKITLLVGAAVGYVLGTRAGRERYEQIKQGVGRLWNDPRLKERVSEAEHFVTGTARDAVDTAREKVNDFRHN